MTTNHSALEDLRKTGAPLVKARVVDDGDLVSGAGGVRLGLDIALWLVERYFDPQPPLLLKTGLSMSGATHCGGAQRVELTRA